MIRGYTDTTNRQVTKYIPQQSSAKPAQSSSHLNLTEHCCRDYCYLGVKEPSCVKTGMNLICFQLLIWSFQSLILCLLNSYLPFWFYTMLSLCLQQIGLLITSFLNTLLSAACCTGLILAISVTVAHNGQGLMLGCNDTQLPINARSPVSAQCPFDTTRIYVSLNFPLAFPSL